MSITVKDVNGEEHNVAGLGLGGTALGLSIGALGSLLLGGLGLSASAASSSDSALSQKEFYEMELLDRDREFSNYQTLQQEICDLAQRVSVNETANTYQNMLNTKQFECVDKQMEWDRLATTYQIQAATANKVEGQLTVPLSTLSNGFRSTDNYIATYSNNGLYSNYLTSNYNW